MKFGLIRHKSPDLSPTDYHFFKDLNNFFQENNVESPLDYKEVQPVHSKGDQSWVFIGKIDAKAETPILWPPHAKI